MNKFTDKDRKILKDTNDGINIISKDVKHINNNTNKMRQTLYKTYVVAFLLSLPILFLHKAEWTGVWDFAYHYIANPLFFIMIVTSVMGGIKKFEETYID